MARAVNYDEGGATVGNTLPHHYQVHLMQNGDQAVLSSGTRPPVIGGPPPEFGGQAVWWSPEHLLVSAVGLCFTATFRSFAARTDLSPRFYTADAEGVLDKTADGIQFVAFRIHVSLAVAAGQSELARGLLERAKKHCLVAKSLKVPVDVVASVSETSAVTTLALAG